MFCPSTLFKCRLCSGNVATSVLDPRDCTLQPVRSNSCITCTEPNTGSIFALSTGEVPPLSSPSFGVNKISSISEDNINTPLCDTLFETAGQCGDSQLRNLPVGSLTLQASNHQQRHSKCITLLPIKINFEAHVLVNLHDEPFHGLASLKQVGDYAEPPKQFSPTSSLELINRSITLPDFSSSNTHDVEFDPKTTTTPRARPTRSGLWRKTCFNTRRPQAPTRFSMLTNSALNVGQYSSCLSLSRKIPAGNPSSHGWSRSRNGKNHGWSSKNVPMADTLGPTISAHCGSYTANASSGNPIHLVSTAASLVALHTSVKKHPKSLLSFPTNNSQRDPCSSSGELLSVYDRSLMGLINSDCQTTSDGSTILQARSNPQLRITSLSGRHCSPCSYSDLDSERLTETKIQNLMVKPTKFSVSKLLAGSTERTLNNQFLGYEEETTRMDSFSSFVFDSCPKFAGKENSTSISCVLSSLPVASGPPSIHIRPDPPGITSVPPLCLAVDDQTFSLPSLKASRSLIMRQQPIQSVVKTEPFVISENYCKLVEPNRLNVLKNESDLDNLDLNTITSTICELLLKSSDISVKPDEDFRCVYSEISLRRNLNSVPLPESLTSKEAQTIRTLLSRRLQNAVATHFLPSAYSAKQNTGVHASGKQSDPVEDGDLPLINQASKLTPINRIKDRGDDQRLSTVLMKFGKMYRRNSLIKQDTAGTYIFTRGLKQCKPPKPWLDHMGLFPSDAGRSVASWKIEDLQIHVGGMFNYGHHLHIVASSNDGRIGLLYQQAESVLSEMTQKGTRYVDGSVMDSVLIRPGDSLRLFIRAPILVQLISTHMEDMSATLGVEETAFAISVLVNNCASEPPDTIMIQSRTLGYRTVFLDHINDIFNCVSRLKVLHHELICGMLDLNHQVMPVERIEYLLERVWKHPSYVRDLLTRTLVEEMKLRKTVFGGTLSHCIRINAYCPHEMYPQACDPDAYEVFKELYEPIIKRFSLVNNTISQPSPCYTLPCDQMTKLNLHNMLHFRICFSRNLHGFGFPPVMSKQDFHKVELACKKALLSWKEEGTGSWYPLNDLKYRNNKLFCMLQRKQLLMPPQDVTSKVFGTYRFWPYGRSIYVAPAVVSNCDLVVQINAEDHLQVICVDWTGKRPLMAYNRAVRLITWLETKLVFCKSPRWGFLSPLPTHVGTGLSLTFRFKISNTGRNPITAVEQVCARHRLQLCLIRHPESPMSPYVFEISPISTVGRTENDLTIRFLQASQDINQTFGKYIAE